MDINNLMMPPLTDEEKRQRVAEWKEAERVRRDIEQERLYKALRANNERIADERNWRNEQDVQNQVEAMRRFKMEEPPQAAWAKPDSEKEFNVKLAALNRWMISKGLVPNGSNPILLRHHPELNYTKEKIYAELCKFDKAFHIAESTFNDFWQKQKLLKYK